MSLFPSVIETSDKGFLMSGVSHISNSSTGDALLIRTDSMGNVVWSNCYGNANDESAVCALDMDGSYYFTGSTDLAGQDEHILLSKVDYSGNMQWSRVITNFSDEPAKLLSINGYIFIAGYRSSPVRHQDFRLTKVDTAGNVLWSKGYGTEDPDYLNEIVHTQDGGFLLTGYTYFFDSLNMGLLVVKTDSLGNMEWTKTYNNGIPQQKCFSVQLDDGTFMLSGWYYQNTYRVGFVMHIDQNGSIIWEKHYRWISNFFMRKSDNGSVLVGGDHLDMLSSKLHGIIYKLDTTGNLLWSRNYIDTLDVTFFSMIQSTDSSFVVSGHIGYSPQSYFLLIKLNDSLEYNCSANEVLLPEPGVHFSNSSLATEIIINDTSYVTSLLTTPVQLVENTWCYATTVDEIGSEDVFVYPNPFHSLLSIDGSEITQINIYDLLGKMVYSTSLARSINLEKLRNGLYMLEIHTGRAVRRKMVLKQ